MSIGNKMDFSNPVDTPFLSKIFLIVDIIIFISIARLISSIYNNSTGLCGGVFF